MIQVHMQQYSYELMVLSRVYTQMSAYTCAHGLPSIYMAFVASLDNKINLHIQHNREQRDIAEPKTV